MRSLVSLIVLGLAACVGPSVALVEAPAEPNSEASSSTIDRARFDVCVPLEGDLSRCCPSRLGLDPNLARDRCGWSEYLGEHSEISCVHVFRDRQGEQVELRVTPVLGLDFAGALALLETSFVEAVEAVEAVERERWTGSEEREIATLRHAGDNWALVAGWPAPRRVNWRTRDCADEAMSEVLRAMSEAPVEAAGAIALPEFELAEAIAPAGLLLDRPITTRDPSDLRLPADAPALAQALIDRAAANELVAFIALLAPDARWGLPDRRQLGARAIGTDQGDAGLALLALRQAAARMPTGAAPTCPAPDRRMRAALARGEHPQWCFWLSEDGLDVIAISLRSVEGQARIDYLGVFPQRPREPLIVSGEPPAPPLSPRPPVHCGDPHHHDLVRCPELAEPQPEVDQVEVDQVEVDQENQRPASTIR